MAPPFLGGPHRCWTAFITITEQQFKKDAIQNYTISRILHCSGIGLYNGGNAAYCLCGVCVDVVVWLVMHREPVDVFVFHLGLY